MKHTYDNKSDAVYIYLNKKPYSFVKRFDDERSVDYSADGAPIGVELLYVSSGVNVTGLPKSDDISKILKGLGIASYNFETPADNQGVFSGISSANVCYSVANDPSLIQYDKPQCTFVHTRQFPKSIRIPALEEVTA